MVTAGWRKRSKEDFLSKWQDDGMKGRKVPSKEYKSWLLWCFDQDGGRGPRNVGSLVELPRPGHLRCVGGSTWPSVAWPS